MQRPQRRSRTRRLVLGSQAVRLHLTVLEALTFDPLQTIPNQEGLFAGVVDALFTSFGTTTKLGLFSSGVVEYAWDIKAGGVVDIIENGVVVSSSIFTALTGTEYDFIVLINADLQAEYWTRDEVGLLTLRYTGTYASTSLALFAEVQNTGAVVEDRAERLAIGATIQDAPVLLTRPTAYDAGYSSGYGTAFRNIYT